MLTEQDRITARTALGMDPTSKNEVATLDLSPVKRASSLASARSPSLKIKETWLDYS